MNQTYQHPAVAIAETMSLIYRHRLTTTSGGNISVRRPDGRIWITPAAADKGTLTEKSIVEVRPEGTWNGPHRPSSELPFHQAVYRARPDLGAVIHAHPPALVAFSIVRQTPNTAVISQAQKLCGPVGYAPYELPGSEALGLSIAGEFGKGFNCVIMENHGTVVGGRDLTEAFQRFETLEFCARTIIRAHEAGKPHYLNREQIEAFENRETLPADAAALPPTDEELKLRHQLCDLIHRACRQGLMISSYGTISARLNATDFIINPTGADRRRLQPADLVIIRNGRSEPGKQPSRAARLHQTIFRRRPDIACIISTQSPNVTAFCVARRPMDTRTIPESYILLEDIPLLTFDSLLGEGMAVAEALARHVPILFIENDSILVTGASILETFDRLEVAEFSARSLLDSRALGDMVPIKEEELLALREKFLRD